MDRLPTRQAYGLMISVEVTTDRLLLRGWREEDVEPLHEIYLQPELLATMPALDPPSAPSNRLLLGQRRACQVVEQRLG